MKNLQLLLLTLFSLLFSLNKCQTNEAFPPDCSSISHTVVGPMPAKNQCLCEKNYFWNIDEQRCWSKDSIIKCGNFTEMLPNQMFYYFWDIKGWKATKGVEISPGISHNSKFKPKQLVAQLDVMQNTEMWTVFRFQQSGKYILSFDYSFSLGLPFQSSLFNVTIGSMVVWSASVNDSSFDRKTIVLNGRETVKGEETYLSFIGTGTQDAQGAFIGDIAINHA